MREETHTIKIYTYSELSDKAKGNAYENFVMNNAVSYTHLTLPTIYSV